MLGGPVKVQYEKPLVASSHGPVSWSHRPHFDTHVDRQKSAVKDHKRLRGLESRFLPHLTSWLTEGPSVYSTGMKSSVPACLQFK